MKNVIEIRNLKKQYRLGAIGGKTFTEDLKDWIKCKIGKKDLQSKKKTFWALNGIDIDIKQGETVAIIGKNGAGKSTLLKLLSRVTSPTEGEIRINGKITSMLEVGTGFHGELTGRQNIYLNGAILGMTKEEIDNKLEDIIEFSECSEFIDTPVKRYSSGMYVKLAFAVASHLDSDIVIMDEVLAVGDANFQKKCLDKMYRMAKEDNKTIIYVSHNMSTVRELCQKGIVLEKGRVIYNGEIEGAIKCYLGVAETMITAQNYANQVRKATDITGEAIIHEISMKNIEDGIVELGNKLEIETSFECKEKLDNPCFRLVVHTMTGRNVGTSMTSRICNCEKGDLKKVRFDLDISVLSPGRYAINFILFSPNGYGGFVQYDVVDNGLQFQVVSTKGKYYSLEWIEHAWGNIALPEINILDEYLLNYSTNKELSGKLT